jgi:hypothetical protein
MASRFPARLCVPALLLLLAAPASAGGLIGDGPPVEGPDYWRGYDVELEMHPVGYSLRRPGLVFTRLMPIQPSGYPSDRFSYYLSPVYGLGRGLQVTAAVTGAEALGPPGEALFYGLGLQQQLLDPGADWRRPALSVGITGYQGPRDESGGTLYLAGSARVSGAEGRPQALFLHAGLKGQLTHGDLGASTGIRPFVGTTVAFTRRLFVSGEFSPPQPWERSHVYAVRATVKLYRRFGISGGIRNNGYRTSPFIRLSL